jgi:hypothetical protein
VDFDVVFALVMRIESMQLLLALTAQKGWPVDHMDMNSTFLNEELVEEVYVHQPPGFVVVDGQEDKVLHLDKELHRLRQAPRTWNAKLDETPAALGFNHSTSEHAVYARGEGCESSYISLSFSHHLVCFSVS